MVELAARMKVKRDELVEITRIFKVPLSLEESVQSAGTGEQGTHEPLLEVVMHSDLKRRLDTFLAHLSPREEEILRLRYGADGTQDEHSLQEIGRKFNLSRERIRQIERSALIKLRKMNSINELKEFLN